MKKILIVDDDPDIIDLVENRLKMNNYNVVTANDGEGAIKMALQETPDLIIMDVMMPNMNGGEAVKTLKANEATKSIPVLFFTALNSGLPEGEELERINVNGQFYPAMAKPFDPKKLLSSIKLLLREPA